VLGEGDCQRQTDIAQADHGDDGRMTLDFGE